MIHSIDIKNYKASRDVFLKFKPLTVLSGLNGSGKSSVLQVIALIRQSLAPLHGSIARNRVIFNGPLINLGLSAHLITKDSDSEYIYFEMFAEEMNAKWSVNIAESDTHSAKCKVDGVTNSKFFKYIRELDFQYLQADRLTPKFFYETPIFETDTFLGVRGENTPNFLTKFGNSVRVSSQRQATFDTGKTGSDIADRLAPTNLLLDSVSRWLQHICPGASVSAIKSDIDEVISLTFNNYRNEEFSVPTSVRPPNIGFGLTYVLPIIVACLSASRGALLLLENPEAHIHPRGQVALGFLVAQCCADGVQIIVETHSDHFMNGVRLAAKSKKIPHTDVAFCHFTRDNITGDSFVQHPYLNEDGSIDDWPEGFFDEWEKALEGLVF